MNPTPNQITECDEYPDHDRTSCSDEDLNNRGFSESGNAYCRRCNALYIDQLQQRINELEQQLKTATEALDWVLKDYKGICRKGFQPSANWKKRIVMADSVLRYANNLEANNNDC